MDEDEARFLGSGQADRAEGSEAGAEARLNKLVLTRVEQFASGEEFRQLEAEIANLVNQGHLADVTRERLSAPAPARHILHLFSEDVWELIAPDEAQRGHFVPVAHYFDWPDGDG